MLEALNQGSFLKCENSLGLSIINKLIEQSKRLEKEKIATTFIMMCFSRHYRDLYNSVDSEWTSLYNTVCKKIHVDSKNSYNHTIRIDDVIRCKRLKPGKSNGFDGLTYDYIINRLPLLF